MRFKPTKENLIEWRDAGMSLNDMKEICGYSKASLSQFFDEYGLKKSKPGRKRGFKVSEETKRKLSETMHKIYREDFDD
ncbi:MAG: hypothetical protein GYA51_00585 [Candidatus Methanofastidiosa archaeon]|nr:hypothetical protein [Candidatus Methanofastidiosa archaeon]